MYLTVKLLIISSFDTPFTYSFSDNVTFNAPVYLEKDKYYALALVSTEAQGEVYTAKIGARDSEFHI